MNRVLATCFRCRAKTRQVGSRTVGNLAMGRCADCDTKTSVALTQRGRGGRLKRDLCPVCNRDSMNIFRTTNLQPMPEGDHYLMRQRVEVMCPACNAVKSVSTRSRAISRQALRAASGRGRRVVRVNR